MRKGYHTPGGSQPLCRSESVIDVCASGACGAFLLHARPVLGYAFYFMSLEHHSQPVEGARVPLSPAQGLLLALIPLALLAAALRWPAQAPFGAGLLLLLFYALVVGHKLLAVGAGLLRRHTEHVSPAERAALDPAGLPVYSILVPVYREAGVVASLVRQMEGLDYPRAKLDIQILVETDDSETRAALARECPDWIRVTVVPPGTPRTKPRACNQGLAEARGELTVVFDAEDRPEPDQLKKAVVVFRRLPPGVICLQARLNWYNAMENLLTRWFSLEYSTWFDLYLPGLHALHAPIPLGGTSNHFRMDALRALGGWDAWNVTEDCDLGIRIARAGYETRILDSTTWEECPAHVGAWLRQRSRWVKGYIQTLFVHLRSPFRLLRELGLPALASFKLTVGGQVLALLLNPVCWMLFAAWLWRQWSLFDPYRPWTVVLVFGAGALLLFNLVFILIHALGGYRRGFHGLLLDCLTMPAYWFLGSLGAWRGFIQFFTAPFHWEKTAHGVSDHHSAAWMAAHHRRLPRWMALPAVALATFAVLFAAVWLPWRMGVRQQVEEARCNAARPRLLLSGTACMLERALEVDWTGRTRVDLAFRPAGGGHVAGKARCIVYLSVLDGEWYQFETGDLVAAPDGTYAVSLPLDAGWRALDSGLPWGAWCLRRVRAIEVAVFGPAGRTRLALSDCTAIGEATAGAIAIGSIAAPATVPCRAKFEATFALSHEFANPFDADEIRIDAIVQTPGGSDVRVPAFYDQPYVRSQTNGVEVLTAAGAPRWAFRYSPREAGEHAWHLEGVAREGGAFRSAVRVFTATPRAHRGNVVVDPDRRHFAFENGEFLYPVAMNFRSPTDDRNRNGWGMPMPSEAAGTYLVEDYLRRMRASGVTMVRQWMTPWWLGLEWRADWPGFHGIGRYNLRNAWRLDHVLQTVEELDLLLELTLDWQGPYIVRYDTQWPDNPYNAAHGGPLQDGSQALTLPFMRKQFENRYRYVAGRYGYSPNLFGWVLWNEVNEVHPDPRVLADWHRDMARYLRSIDPGRHLISTEFILDPGVPEVWSLPEIEYTQLSAYNRGHGLVPTFVARVRDLAPFDKPRVLEEYGGHAGGCDAAPTAQEIHDGLWAGWMLDTAATPMAWWWNFIVERDLLRFHRIFARFIENEDLRGTPWQFRQVGAAATNNLAALLRVGPDRAYGWVYLPEATDIAYVKRDWEGQPRAFNRAYRGLVQPGFDTLRPDPGPRFPAVTECRVSLSGTGLRAGTYAVERWDTWDETRAPETRTNRVDDATNMLVFENVTRDFALRLRRVD